MGVVLGWVVFAVAGVAVAPHAERNQAQITYTVRMAETDGVAWREAIFNDLKPVTRQGAVTVWTVSRGATTHLLSDLCKNPAAKILEAPRVTALNLTAATIQCRTNRPVVTQAAWHSPEPAFLGAPENVRVGWHTTMVGRKLDQGILVQIVFEDTVIRAVHRVAVNRPDNLACSAAASSGTMVPQLVTASGKAAGLYAYVYSAITTPAGTTTSSECCSESESCGQSKESDGQSRDIQKVVVEVPEIDTQEVVGEWLVPHGDVLLVSFGAHTVADKAGRAIVKERLAIIEAVEATEFVRPAVLPTPLPAINVPIPRLAESAPKLPMPTPIMPSRSIPRGIHADGTPAELPPLPADETETESSESESSEPRPSPQTKKVPEPKPTTDSGANKAEFSLPKAAAMFLPSFLLPGQSTGFQFLLPIKPLSVKLPFGQKLEVEVFGKIVPEAEAH